METEKPRPQGLLSRDECGLWMKMDSNPVTDHTLVSCGEKPQDETKVPAVIMRYYSVMDDEGADDDFVPPPPPHTAPFLPAEGSTGARVNNSSVTLTKGAAEAAQANDNPRGLDWHHGERQLMASQNKADEVIVSTEQTSKASLSEDSILPKDQIPMEEACYDPTGRRLQENTTGDKESDEEPEGIVILSEGQEKCRETEAGKDKYPKQVPSSIEENSENERHFDKEKESGDVCGLAETDSKLTTENVNCGEVETIAPTESGLRASGDDFESYGPPELFKCDQNMMDSATCQPQVQDVPAEESNGDEEHVDTGSLNYTLTKYNWMRRESGATSVSRLSISEGSEEMATKDKQGDGNSRISTGIQQGEQLLQRLQLLQLRQDASTPESPHASWLVGQETRSETKRVLGTEIYDLKSREAHLTGGDEKEESRFHSIESEGVRTNLRAMENENERKDVEAKAGMSSSTTPVESEHHKIARAEAGDSDDDQSDSWVPADLSQIDPKETSSSQIPFLSSCHRRSVVETCIEMQTLQEAQEKQNLQRAGGVFNLPDNPDVLEIPFKNNILLEPFLTKDGPEQRSDWQFSEQRMKKEISQEMQRELVLVNQGKIPGGYSKGEVRQLRETKLLFETFQQDNTEGLTRHRKPPMKGHVYPSVLERTRSLEMLSFKSCPISRAHSFRLYKETEKHAEILRPMSPTCGSRDKTRSSPFAKPDKHAPLCRSMDSINTDVSTSAVDTRSEIGKGNGAQESPILRGNPFFKLRPALALKPEVEKDIREAKKQEEELRRQICTLYGESRRSGEDGERSRFKPMPDVRKQSRGKLERVWPPPSKKDQMKSEQTQQEPKVHQAGGQRAPLWQRWESGLINGKTSKEKN
ncbi:uncharacterized protein LOC116396297 [Anarrhichthys ocellatus]|uniref:uncharacterized protein LOC116396297 n=1 Tax=Anarrhichthys ocellatus TaxID=433405 RepID=UPI0012ED9775|nr:uncharacterized protein LOC116396297 [Anarrhichthys ocellatus]